MRRPMAQPLTEDANGRPPHMEQQYHDSDSHDDSSQGKSKVTQARALVPQDGRTSQSQSILNLINCILGAGVLGYPYCFKSCGLVLATVLLLVSVAASRFSYNLLLYSAQISNKRTYEELAEQAIGRAGRQIVDLCTAAINLGCIVAYLNILADVLSAVAGTIIPPGAEPSRNAFIAGVSIFGALPVALIVRDHSVVAAFSAASVGFIIIFAVVVVVFAVSPAVTAGNILLWRTEGLLVAFPIVVYSFTAHPYYLGIYNTLQNANFKRMDHVTNVAVLMSMLLYWVVGVGGYVTFKNRTAGDLLRNFGAANVGGLRGAYERAIKLCYGLSILGSIPLVILPFYNILLPMLGNDHQLQSVPSGGKRRASFESSASHTSNADTGTPTGRRHRAPRVSHEVDVVDLKLHHEGHEGEDVPFSKHAVVVMMILGLALASAIWVPNVEFILGLTGATASVLLSYILPSITFIKLMDATPELLGGGKFLVIPPEIKSQWVWRKRKAILLLCFGVVSGITCTDAILGAVKQEAAVVQLAQQLVAHEVVVAETAKVQQKAKEAVTAVSAVEQAAKQLGQANINATGTLDKLVQAAAALNTIANATTTDGHWGIQNMMKEHQQHAAETKVLKTVESALDDVKEDVHRTMASVNAVIAQLDAALAQLRAEQASEQAALLHENKTASTSSSKGKSAHARAEDLALELGKALGAYSSVAVTNATEAGKSMTQVKATALSALAALNATAAVLDRVSLAVSAAKKSNKHDDEIKQAAAQAMQMALNATAVSALATQLTTEALQRSANEEASELLQMLTQVSQDLQKAQAKTKTPKVKRTDEAGVTITLVAGSTGAAAGTTGGAGQAAGGSGSSSSSSGSSSGSGSQSATTAADATSHSQDTGAAAGAGGAAAAAPTVSGGKPVTEAAGQLEKVIQDLNTKLTAATTATAAQGTAAAAAAAGGTAAAADSAGTAATLGDSSSTTTSAGTTGAAASGATEAGQAGASAAGAGNSTAAGGAGLANLNMTGIAAALKDAVVLTQEKQKEALEHIKESLGKTESVVAERVVDILKDMSDTKRQEDQAAANKGTAATVGITMNTDAAAILKAKGEKAVGASVTTATDVADAAAATTIASSGSDQGSAQGPVVKVDQQGHLVQEEDAADGPVVKAGAKDADGKDQQQAAADAAAAADDEAAGDGGGGDAGAQEQAAQQTDAKTKDKDIPRKILTG